MATRQGYTPLVNGTEAPSSPSLLCTITEGGLVANWLLRSFMSCRICRMTPRKLSFCASRALTLSSGASPEDC